MAIKIKITVCELSVKRVADSFRYRPVILKFGVPTLIPWFIFQVIDIGQVISLTNNERGTDRFPFRS